jgi:elongator complex protein 6
VDYGAGTCRTIWIANLTELFLFFVFPSLKDSANEITMNIQRVHSAILTLSADFPLIHNASASSSAPSLEGGGIATPLETEHAAFAIGLAHRARMVMQLRNLATGAAKDVSGVLRVSKGGAASDEEERDWDEKEVLYFVQRDAGVRVFGRGE